MTEYIKIISNTKLSNCIKDKFNKEEPTEFKNLMQFYKNKLVELNISNWVELTEYNDGMLKGFRIKFKSNLLYEDYITVMSILKLYNIYEE